jgi:glycosyltransferase involved in cell wall biosynthesis
MRAEHSPLVSVVIPSYNHAQYIGRALQSVLDQTYAHWEAIIIDNHSTDNTDEVVNKFKDPRITYLKIHNNGVIASSRNMGIRSAKGEWIAFLDSDDWWDINKLEMCLSQGQDEVDFIYHKLKCYSVTDSKSIIVSGSIEAFNISISPYKSLLDEGTAMTTSTVIVRTSCINSVDLFDMDINLVGGEDYDLWVRLAKTGYKFKMINSFLGYYLVNGLHVTSAINSLRLLDALEKKYFGHLLYSVPNWMHKSKLSSYFKLKRYPDIAIYLKNMLFELPIYRTVQILALLLRSVIVTFFSNKRTIR